MTSPPSLAVIQRAEGAPLALDPWTPPDGPDPLLEVVATSPAAHDLVPPAAWPRLPGGALAARDAQGALWICGGTLPCGRCSACQCGLLLACEQPVRPGWNAPGGMAGALRLPPGSAPGELAVATLPQVVALLGAAGLAYQAQASAGMVPGDSVVVVGAAGPGALPLRLLLAGGLRPIWLDGDGPPPDGVEARSELPGPAELPSARCHLLDLRPTEPSLARWQPLARSCLSLTLLGPERGQLAAPHLAGLVGGQACLRWIRDLHPHLVLDVAALVTTGRLDLEGTVEALRLADAVPALERFLAGRAERWPVAVTSLPR